MEEHALGSTKGGDFVDREQNTGFVVGPHYGDQSSIRSNGGFQLAQVQRSFTSHWQKGNFVTLLFQIRAKLKRGRMLNRGCDEVATLRLDGQSAVDSSIDALRSTTRENDLAKLSINE